MPAPKTPQRVRLDELLADGEWHDREPLVVAAAAAVPPGVAARHARHQRAAWRARYHRRNGTAPPPTAIGRPSDDVRVGARHLAITAIRTAVAQRAYQQRTLPDGTTIQIRRRPEMGGE